MFGNIQNMKVINYTLALLFLCSCTTKPRQRIICEANVPIKIVEVEDRYEVTADKYRTVKFSTERKENSTGLISKVGGLLDETTELVTFIVIAIILLV